MWFVQLPPMVAAPAPAPVYSAPAPSGYSPPPLPPVKLRVRPSPVLESSGKPSPAPHLVHLRDGRVHCHAVGPLDQVLSRLFGQAGWQVSYLGKPAVQPTVALFGAMRPAKAIATLSSQVRSVAHIYLNPAARMVTVVYLSKNIQV